MKIKRSKLLYAIIISGLISVTCYFANNSPFLTENFLYTHSLSQYLYSEFIKEDKHFSDNVLFIDVSKDNELVDIYEDSVIVGNTKIANRQRLYTYLKNLKKDIEIDAKPYKYLIIDIFFDEKHKTAYDDSLFSIIKSLDRTLVVNYSKDNKSFNIANDYIEKKSGTAQYNSTIIETNFTRFPFLNIGNGEKSVVLKAYEELNPNMQFKRVGFGPFSIFVSGNKLCRSAAFITFDRDSITNIRVLEEQSKYENRIGVPDTTSRFSSDYRRLGEYLSHSSEIMPILIQGDANGKYIIIGNLEDDIHDTYIGKKPGSFIVYKALEFLDNNKHIINPITTFIWFLIYIIVIYFIIKGYTIANQLKIKSTLWKSILDIFTFSTFLILCEIPIYLIFEEVHNLFVPILAITILKLYINLKKQTYE